MSISRFPGSFAGCACSKRIKHSFQHFFAFPFFPWTFHLFFILRVLSNLFFRFVTVYVCVRNDLFTEWKKKTHTQFSNFILRTHLLFFSIDISFRNTKLCCENTVCLCFRIELKKPHLSMLKVPTIPTLWN